MFFIEIIVGVLEEIDDSLEIDCSSQSSTDSETEQYEYATSVDTETFTENSEEFNIQPIQTNKSKRSQKTPKTNKGPKTNGMNPRR